MMSQTDSIEMLLELELVQDVEDNSNRQNVGFAQDHNKIIQFSYRWTNKSALGRFKYITWEIFTNISLSYSFKLNVSQFLIIIFL